MCFQPPSLPIGKVLALVMPFCVWHTPYKVLWRGGRRLELFSAAFDRVNHRRILFRLCSVEFGGSVLCVLTQFLSNRSQYVVVDGCRSKLVKVLSGVPQGSVLGPQLWYVRSMWYDLWGMKLNASKTRTMIVSRFIPSQPH